MTLPLQNDFTEKASEHPHAVKTHVNYQRLYANPGE